MDKQYDKFIAKIAANVAKLRKAKGWTQEDMSDHGYSYRHYQRIESGKHSPSLLTLYRLAQTFKVDPKELLK